MKTITTVLSLMLSTMVWAQGTHAETKLDKKQAKMECLKDNPNMKGKELSKCVSGKTK